MPETAPLSASPALVPGADEVHQMDFDAIKRMTINVSIDDQGPFDFLIDTGAEKSAISLDIADLLQLVPGEEITLSSIAGQSVVSTAYIDNMRLGKYDYGALNTLLLHHRHIGADGILGLDGLQNRRVLFDFKKQIITVNSEDSDFSTRGYEIIVTARRIGHQLIMRDARLADKKINVIIDTGSEANIGNAALEKMLRRVPRDLVSDGNSELMSVTGQILPVRMKNVRNFRMDRLGFDYIPIAFAQSPVFADLGLEDKPTLLLGMTAIRQFDRMMIDFDRKKVYFDVPNG